MIEVRLPRGVWRYDADMRLGSPGGFGAVFAGVGADGAPIAVKRLHVAAGEAAHREMDIAEHLVGKQFQHILPLFDAGLDGNSDAYFVVMPRADRSLNDEIRERGHLEGREGAGVLLEIAKGITEIPELTHRDLKPANILFHGGAWKIADFGIARFVESVTSAHTLKDCLSPAYAAPEQWRLERATGATDVYALGCIAHAVLTGNPPFRGTREELGQQHQTADPPTLASHLPMLRSIVSMMLRKVPQTRPSVERIASILREVCSDTVSTDEGAGIKALAGVGAEIAEAESSQEARRAQELQRLHERSILAAEAKRILNAIWGRLCAQVGKSAPAVVVAGRRISLGQAFLELEFFGGRAILAGSFPNSGWDVVTGAVIMVIQERPDNARGASLLYADGRQCAGYRWYELAFVSNPLMGRRRPSEPFALQADELRDADMAIGPGMHTVQLASPPTPIDDEDEAAFIDRWAAILAKAAQGQLP